MNFDFSELFFHTFSSLWRVLLGVVIAIFIAFLLATLRFFLPSRIKDFLPIQFFFEFIKYPPPIAWIPFVIIVFGIGNSAAIALVFIGAFSPLFTGCYEGLSRTSSPWIEVGDMLGFSQKNSFFEIRLRLALPKFFLGLKAALSMGWMSVIAAELVAGDSGLGYAIQMHRLSLEYEKIAIEMLVIGIVGFVLFRFVDAIEVKMCPWIKKGML